MRSRRGQHGVDVGLAHQIWEWQQAGGRPDEFITEVPRESPHSEAFMGWYVAADGSVRSKGTLYFELHPHGQMMRGMWAGQSYVGPVVHGWCAVARERATSEALIRDMARTQGHLKAWPNLNKS